MIERLPALGPTVRIMTYGMLIALPASVAGVNIFGGLVLITALLSREFWGAGRRLLSNPMVLVATFMLGLLLLGMLYTTGPQQDALAVLTKYRKLLFIPLLLPFFQEDRHRTLAMTLLALSIFFTVLMSWSEFLGLTHISDPIYGGPPGDAVFKMHIPQGTLFALQIVLCVGLALATRSWMLKILFMGMAFLTTLDIAWVMVGRTGKAMLPLIALWAIWEWLRFLHLEAKTCRRIVIGAVAVILGATLWVASRPTSMLGSVTREIHQSLETGVPTSQGIRLAFFGKSAELIAQRPWVGYGTGSVMTETEILAAKARTEVARIPTVNLHNEFLMWAVQLGWPGLTAILLFFMILLRASFKQSIPVGILIRGQWVVFVAGCMFNSYLLDFAEGYALVFSAGILLPL
ncbi:MAG: O-antigen ligase family protein [Betaproteobacteria bacterium]|nr:O-antigen ligase family protein [Betaproteobacteria bacterium]